MADAPRSYKNAVVQGTRKKNNRTKNRLLNILPLLGFRGYPEEAYRLQQTSRAFRNQPEALESVAQVRLGPARRTPLMAAARSGNTARVQRLLASRAPGTAESERAWYTTPHGYQALSGVTNALTEAVKANSLSTVRELVERGGYTREKLSTMGLLYTAIWNGNLEMAQYLLEKGVPFQVNYAEFIHGNEIRTESPSIMAYCRLRNSELFQFLLPLERRHWLETTQPPNPEAYTYVLDQLVELAAEFGDLETLDQMFALGATKQALPDKSLEIVIGNGMLEVLQHLAEHNVPIEVNFSGIVYSSFPEATEPYTGNVLAFAIHETLSLPLVQFLVEHGANVNGIGYLGESAYEMSELNNNNYFNPEPYVTTPLFEAARAGAENILFYLLEQGANKKWATRSQSLLSEIVSSRNLPMLKRFLERYGSDLDLQQEAAQFDVLNNAIYKADYEMVQYLLDAGVHPDTNDALRAAVSTLDERLIQMLLFAGADATGTFYEGGGLLNVLLRAKARHPEVSPKYIQKLYKLLEANGAKNIVDTHSYGGGRRKRVTRKRKGSRRV